MFKQATIFFLVGAYMVTGCSISRYIVWEDRRNDRAYRTVAAVAWPILLVVKVARVTDELSRPNDGNPMPKWDGSI
jgi:hypothetical protein